MGSLDIVKDGKVPVVHHDTARLFDAEHGEPDGDPFFDGVIRSLQASNPEFMDEIDRVANRILNSTHQADTTLVEDLPFLLKRSLILGTAIGAALLAKQASIDNLEILWSLPSEQGEDGAHPEA